MQLDFLNRRAVLTVQEGASSNIVSLYALENGEVGEMLQQVFTTAATETELKQTILQFCYPLPAVQPPPGSPEQLWGAGYAYRDQRAMQYPDLGEQLDMLYKDLKNGTTTFIEAVEAVKNAVPKPDAPVRPVGMSPEYKAERLRVWNEMYGFDLTVDEYYDD